MTQPRPNADQVRRRFSASAVASALVVEFSGTGVCLGARRPVPAAKAKRLLCDQREDLRRNARQWARCADSGRSRNDEARLRWTLSRT